MAVAVSLAGGAPGTKRSMRMRSWRYWYWKWWTQKHVGKPAVDLGKLGLTADQHAVIEVYLKLAEGMRDEAEAKAWQRQVEYEDMRRILDAYAEQGNWRADAQGRWRCWAKPEAGYTLAQAWLKKRAGTY